MTDPWIGKTLGRYLIEGELGRGGMGVVYLGRQLSLNRQVAIKVLPIHLALDPQFRERFQQEARLIAALVHENIVHVYDVEEADGTYFIVMERVLGQSVRQLRESRRLSVDEVCAIGGAVARALAVAHAQGIVHRDVKSLNVMVTDEGKVKLMDFGIARVAGTGIKTQTGSVLGTPEYMAPEQARYGQSSPKTDLYSLGVLLYELATGRLPFTGGDPFAVALRQITDAPVAPRIVDPNLPEWLERLILKAMAKDPGERQASVLEMEAELATRGGTVPRGATPVGGVSLTVPAQSLGTTPTGPTKAAGPVEGGSYAPLARPGNRRLGLAAALLVALVGGSWLGYRWLSQPEAPKLASSAEPGPEATSAAPGADDDLNDPVTSPPVVKKPAAEIPAAVVPPPPSATFSARPSLEGGGQAAPSSPAAVPAPAEPPLTSAPEPPWQPIARVVETYRCREAVEFHVDPEKATVIIDGQVLGIADDWDGIGRKARQWKPGPGTYVACFTAKGLPSACAEVILDRHEDDDECDVDLALEDYE